MNQVLLNSNPPFADTATKRISPSKTYDHKSYTFIVCGLNSQIYVHDRICAIKAIIQEV